MDVLGIAETFAIGLLATAELIGLAAGLVIRQNEIDKAPTWALGWIVASYGVVIVALIFELGALLTEGHLL